MFRDKKAQNCVKQAENGVKKAQNCVKNAQNGVKKAQNNFRMALKNIKKASISSKVIKHQFCSNTFKYKPNRARIRIFIPQYSHQWRSHHIFLFDMFTNCASQTDIISSTITLSVLALLHQKSLATSSFSVDHRGPFLVFRTMLSIMFIGWNWMQFLISVIFR